MSKSVLITGGTGLIGSRLTQMLQERGYQVSHLSRSKPDLSRPGHSRKGNEPVKTYVWNIEKQQIEPEALLQADFIIHLAGASLADQRWTESRKRVIIQSRTESTRLLHDSIAQLGTHNIKAFVSASGISVYGSDTGSAEMFESSPKSDEFIAEVVKQWEASVDEIKRLNIRTVKFRTGIVLSTEGGALAKIIQPVKLGMGAPLGNGQQYVSWIHIDDVCRLYIHALEHEEIEGVYNAVAPRPVTNEELTKSAAKILHKPLFVPKVPAFALRLVFGEMASIVLGGNRVSNQKILQTGFNFQYKHIDAALTDLLK